MLEMKVYTDDGGNFSNDKPEEMHEHERHVWIWKPGVFAWFDELDGYHLQPDEFGVLPAECDCYGAKCDNCGEELPVGHVSILAYAGGLSKATCGKTECNTEIAKGLVH